MDIQEIIGHLDFLAGEMAPEEGAENETFDALCAASDMLDEYSKLLEKQKEGRLVELPCKVGDTVYDRFDNAWETKEVDIYADGRILFRCGNTGTDDYCALYADEIFLTPEPAKEGNHEQD